MAEVPPMPVRQVELLGCADEAYLRADVRPELEDYLQQRVLALPPASQAALRARYWTCCGPEFSDALIYACERVFLRPR